MTLEEAIKYVKELLKEVDAMAKEERYLQEVE